MNTKQFILALSPVIAAGSMIARHADAQTASSAVVGVQRETMSYTGQAPGEEFNFFAPGMTTPFARIGLRCPETTKKVSRDGSLFVIAIGAQLAVVNGAPVFSQDIEATPPYGLDDKMAMPWADQLQGDAAQRQASANIQNEFASIAAECPAANGKMDTAAFKNAAQIAVGYLVSANIHVTFTTIRSTAFLPQ